MHTRRVSMIRESIPKEADLGTRSAESERRMPIDVKGFDSKARTCLNLLPPK